MKSRIKINYNKDNIDYDKTDRCKGNVALICQRFARKYNIKTLSVVGVTKDKLMLLDKELTPIIISGEDLKPTKCDNCIYKGKNDKTETFTCKAFKEKRERSRPYCHRFLDDANHVCEYANITSPTKYEYNFCNYTWELDFSVQSRSVDFFITIKGYVGLTKENRISVKELDYFKDKPIKFNPHPGRVSLDGGRLKDLVDFILSENLVVSVNERLREMVIGISELKRFI